MLTETDFINNPAVAEIKNDEPVSKERTGHSFLRQHFSDNSGRIVFVMIAGLVNSITSFLLTVIIGNFYILQFGSNGSKGKLVKLMGVRTDTLSSFFLLFIFLLLVKFISSLIENYLTRSQGEILVKNIRTRLFSTQIQSSNEIFGEKSFGNYLLRYSNDLKSIQNYLTNGILGGIKEFLFFIAGILLLLKINPQLTLILIPLFAAVAGIIIFFAEKQKSFIQQSRDNRSQLLSFVARNFSRFKKIKKESRELNIINRFETKSQNLFGSNLLNHRAESFILSVSSFLQFAIIGFTLWLMAGHGIDIASSDGLVVILVLMLMQGSVRRLLKVPSHLNKGKISINKVSEILKK